MCFVFDDDNKSTLDYDNVFVQYDDDRKKSPVDYCVVVSDGRETETSYGSEA